MANQEYPRGTENRPAPSRVQPGVEHRASSARPQGTASRPASPQRPTAQGQRPAAQGQRPQGTGAAGGQSVPRRPGTAPAGARPGTSAAPATRQPSGAARPAPARAAAPAARPAAKAPQTAPRTANVRRPMPNQARIEAEKKQMAAEKQRAKEAAKEKNRQKIRQITTVLGVSLLLVGVVLLAWYFIGSSGKRPGKVDYQIGDLTYKMPYSAVTAYGVVYVNFTDVAKYLELSSSGDTASMRFLVTDESGKSGDYVRFTAGSKLAEVNGGKVDLPSSVLVLEGAYWVPIDFMNAHMTGVTVTVDATDNVTVLRDAERNDDGEPVELAPIAFSVSRLADWPGATVTTGPDGTLTPGGTTNPSVTDPPVTEPPVTEDPTLAVVNGVSFSIDLSAYESYMNPQGDKRDAYLVLVNKTTTVGKDFAPGATMNLNTAYTYNRSREVPMETQAAMAMEAMFKAMFAAGYTDMWVTSGYRSYDYQLSLYNSYVKKEMDKDSSLTKAAAEAIVDTYSARAGTSEHQSGLCADLHNLSSAQQKFANEKAYTWLCENAWKFGFILRFPEDKTDITGYSFEPWHWRYVGRYHAYQIWSQDLCLEEYLATLD